VFSGELRFNFAVWGKSRLARDSLEEKTTARILRWQLKLTVKSESPLTRWTSKKETLNTKKFILSNQVAGSDN